MKHKLLIIGLAGHAGAGKDTAADYLCMHYGFERYAFAQPIKSMLHALFSEAGVDASPLYNAKRKALPIPELGGASARKLMQTLGTEWGRSVDPDLWTRVAALALGVPDEPVHHRLVLTDVRFPNEADWIRAHGGRIWRISRAQAAPVETHVSEQLLDQIRADWPVSNHGDISELHEGLDIIAKATLATFASESLA